MIIQGEGIYFEWRFEERLSNSCIKNRIQIEIDGQSVNQVNTSLTITQLENLLVSLKKISSREMEQYQSDFIDSILSLNIIRENETIYLMIEVSQEVIQTDPMTTIGIDLLSFTTNDNTVEQYSSKQQPELQEAQLFELEVELTTEELMEFISDIQDNYGAI